MSDLNYINPQDSPQRQREKLERIVEVLMRRVERDTDQSSPNYSHFQAAIVLEKQVKSRTQDLEDALELLGDANAKLAIAKAEAEAARSDLANAIEAIQEGFALFDPGDRLIMRNSRFCAYLPDVAHGLHAGMHFGEYVDLVSQSDYVVFESGMTRTDWVRARLSGHGRKHHSFNVEHKNDRWIQVSEQRTPNNSTAVLQTDVTDMVRLEREERDKLLGTQAELTRATLDHLSQGIAIFDSALNLVGSNQRLREMFSPPQRLLRTGTNFQSIVDFFLAKKFFVERPELESLGKWVHRRENRTPMAISLTTSDDRYFDVFCQETPEQGFVISFTDVTVERTATRALHAVNETLEQRVHERTSELREARDVAERANASKSRFVAAVSHDLLQPLNAAKLFIASLKGVEQPPPAQELTERIGNAFESVETILGALLDITKLDSGVLSTEISSFPVEKLLRPIRDEFSHVAQAKNLTLRVRACDAVIRSDQTYLLRIVQNLVTNAIRYTHSGGVLVAVRPRGGGSVCLEVWDTGMGIPAKHHAEIFQEFRRLNDSGKTDPGVGLGLAIVERACNLLDHELSFSSVEGRGSVFRVVVPRAPSGPANAAATQDAEVMPDPKLTPNICLLIEDDDAAREGMSRLLETWGVNTIEAENGEAASNLLAEIDIVPDALIVDHHLHGQAKGLDVIRSIRGSYGNIPAVLVTADREDALRQHAADVGVILLQKPLEPRRLRSVLTWVQSQSR